MSAKEVAHLLLDVIAKGGNLALNIAAQPDGRLPGRALRELNILSPWINRFSDAIYGTRAAAPYRDGKYAYTASKDGKTVNVFYLYGDGERRAPEYTFTIYGRAVSAVDLGSGAELSFVQKDDMITVSLPQRLVGIDGDIADCIRVSVE